VSHWLTTNFLSQGNYFASHFFMGGEKFDTPHPEGYLFGENMDLNFLGNRPVQVQEKQSIRTSVIWILNVLFCSAFVVTVASYKYINDFFLYCFGTCHSFPMLLQHPTSQSRLWGVSSTSEKTHYDWSGTDSGIWVTKWTNDLS